MNWRRGLLLAGINLGIAVPLIVWLAANDAAYVRGHSIPAQRLVDAPSVPTAPEAETRTVGPCRTIWVDCPAQITIVRLANFPAFVLTYWRSEQPAPWSLAGMLHADSTWPPTPSSVAAQKRVAGVDPSLMVCRKAAAGDDAMDMVMGQKVRAPCVEDGEKSDLGAEPRWIGGYLKQSLGAGFEQQIEEVPRSREVQRVQFVGQGKHDVEVVGVEQVALLGFEPSPPGVCLALGTAS